MKLMMMMMKLKYIECSKMPRVFFFYPTTNTYFAFGMKIAVHFASVGMEIKAVGNATYLRELDRMVSNRPRICEKYLTSKLPILSSTPCVCCFLHSYPFFACLAYNVHGKLERSSTVESATCTSFVASRGNDIR